MLESKLVSGKDGKEYWKEGYFLSIDELKKLAVDFAVDWHNGFVSNIRSYLESRLEKLQK